MKKYFVLLLCLILVLSLAACNDSDIPEQESAQPQQEAAELVWYIPCKGLQPDMSSVMEAVNDYLMETLGCTLNIIPIEFGNYDQQMQIIISSQKEFDLCFTSHWCNDFYTNVSRSAFLPLDTLLETHGQALVQSMPEAGWEAGRVNGVQYGVPNQQIWAMTNLLQVNKSVLEAYHIHPASIRTLEDLEPLLAAYKAEHPESYPFAIEQEGALSFNTITMGYDELAGRHVPGVILLEDDSLTVVNQFELPQVHDFFRTIYNWCQKGYIRPDSATVNGYVSDFKAGLHVATFDGTYKPTSQEMNKLTYGCEMEYILLTDSWLTTSGITAAMTAISRTSQHPELAMELLNLVNTDPYLYNLITQGIAGKHYEALDGTYIRPIEDSGYLPNVDWVFGNQFLAYLKEGQSADDWIITQQLNESATPSPALGFVFDPIPVQDQIASVTAVLKQYEPGLSTGVLDPDVVLPEFLKKLDEAGADLIIAEIQQQLDAWAAAN